MKAIFVFAHPDDESFSSSGTIAKLTKKGVDVKLVTATRGEGGMSGEYKVSSKQELGRIREKELRNAAKVLNISKIYFLNHIDSTLPKISVKKLTREILDILLSEKPDLVFTFNKEGGSRHPDHIAISKCATLAFEEYLKTTNKKVALYYNAIRQSLLKKLEKEGFAYTAFGRIKGNRDDEITTIIDISDVLKKKIQAIKCHKTQQKDWERFLKRTKHEEFRYEYFMLIKENNII